MILAEPIYNLSNMCHSSECTIFEAGLTYKEYKFTYSQIVLFFSSDFLSPCPIAHEEKKSQHIFFQVCKKINCFIFLTKTSFKIPDFQIFETGDTGNFVLIETVSYFSSTQR